MPIQINQLNTAPLAAVAGNSVGNLGLEAYPIDAGAVMKGQAENYWKGMLVQVQREQMSTQMKIQEMANSGQLTTEKAKALSAQSLQESQQKFDAIQKAADRTITQQNANTDQIYKQGLVGVAQGQLGIQQQQLGLNAKELDANIGLKQQELANTQQYQQGQLGVLNRGVDIQKQTADMDNQLKGIQILAAQKADKRNTVGAYASLAFAASKITDPTQRQAALDTILKPGVESGDIPQQEYDSFMKLNPLQQQYRAATLMSMASLADQASSKAKEQGMSFSLDTNGQPLLISNKSSSSSSNGLTGELYKTDAKQAEDVSKARRGGAELLEKISVAKNALQAVPEDMLGPVAGLYSKYIGGSQQDREKLQLFESSINDITLTLKNAYNMGSQGFTNSDRQFVASISGGLKNYKGSVAEILEKLDRVTQHAQVRNWLDEYEIRQRGESENPEYFHTWVSQNPEPEIKMVDAEGKNPHMVPASEMKSLIAKGAKVSD